jgi:hypothetical protein
VQLLLTSRLDGSTAGQPVSSVWHSKNLIAELGQQLATEVGTFCITTMRSEVHSPEPQGPRGTVGIYVLPTLRSDRPPCPAQVFIVYLLMPLSPPPTVA